MKVTITYFKSSGKYYTEDDDVEWPEDPTHYNGWKPFKDLVRIRSMIAVCMDTPMGFPIVQPPQEAGE